MKEKSFKDGVLDALPTAMGYVSIGLAFGMVASPYMTVLEVLLMSMIVYSGSAQFIMVALFAAKQDLASITLTVFLVNIRFLLMSLHISPTFQKASLLNNIAIGTLLTDESYGVFLSEKLHADKMSVSWMHGNNLLGYVAWIVATVCGTLVGNLLPNPELFGLDYALVAMFIGIFAVQYQGMLKLRTIGKILLVLAVVLVTFLALLMVLEQSLAVLGATLLACFVGVLLDER